jgi:hypothetical protein
MSGTPLRTRSSLPALLSLPPREDDPYDLIRRRPLQNLALPKHFVVAASAATKLGDVRFPRAERGAKVVMRAFARLRRPRKTSLAKQSYNPDADEILLKARRGGG